MPTGTGGLGPWEERGHLPRASRANTSQNVPGCDATLPHGKDTHSALQVLGPRGSAVVGSRVEVLLEKCG